MSKDKNKGKDGKRSKEDHKKKKGHVVVGGVYPDRNEDGYCDEDGCRRKSSSSVSPDSVLWKGIGPRSGAEVVGIQRPLEPSNFESPPETEKCPACGTYWTPWNVCTWEKGRIVSVKCGNPNCQSNDPSAGIRLVIRDGECVAEEN